MRKAFLGALASMAMTVGATLAAPAHATAFSGAFDPANWTFDDDGGDGAVFTFAAPDWIGLVGNDNGGGAVTIFSIVAVADGTFDFFWNYLSFDEDGPDFDPFGYFLNGDGFQLTDDDGPSSQSGGLVSVNLQAGDVFGFYIDSTDGCCGPAVATFGDAPAPLASPTPEPAALGLLGVGLLGLFAARRRAA